MAATATLVLDTCALLKDLPKVKELAHFATQYGVEVLLPRETIRELDRIKDKRKQEAIGKTAQKAVNWIGIALSKKDPKCTTVRGQKQHETFKSQLSGDEAILDCAAWYQRASSKPAILVTEDHNLSNRAQIDGVESYRLSQYGPRAIVTLAYDQGISQMCLDDEDDVFYEHEVVTDQQSFAKKSSNRPKKSVKTPPAKPFGNDGSFQQNPALEFMDCDEAMEVESDLELEPNHYQLPPPIDDSAFGRRIMLNIAQLLDWHVHRIFTDSELTGLNYTPPKSSPEFADVLKQFAVAFDAPVSSAMVAHFSAIAYQKHADKVFVSRHVELLKVLSMNDERYRVTIRKSNPT